MSLIHYNIILMASNQKGLRDNKLSGTGEWVHSLDQLIITIIYYINDTL